MLVKLPDEDPKFVDCLKSATRYATASGAYRYAAYRYSALVADIERLQAENAKLRTAVQVQDQLISRARESAAALLDHVAQSDLIDSAPSRLRHHLER